MQVHLIKKETLENYMYLHAASTTGLEDWLTKLNNVDWKAPADIKNTYRSADFLGRGSNRVIFNLGGNNFRMICKYAFGKKQVHLFICWLGTHAAYDRICKEMKQFTINLF